MRKCDYCVESPAAYFAEFQRLDFDYAAETNSPSPIYGWWGAICPTCIRAVMASPDLIWLEAIDAAEVLPIPIAGSEGWCAHEPDWSKATIRVGRREPSEAMRRLLRACDPHSPRVTRQEALERLAELKLRERRR